MAAEEEAAGKDNAVQAVMKLKSAIEDVQQEMTQAHEAYQR